MLHTLVPKAMLQRQESVEQLKIKCISSENTEKYECRKMYSRASMCM